MDPDELFGPGFGNRRRFGRQMLAGALMVAMINRERPRFDIPQHEHRRVSSVSRDERKRIKGSRKQSAKARCKR